MRAYDSSTRISATFALVLQLVLGVGLPLADASHGMDTERRAHVERRDGAPCSPGHSQDGCELARVLGTGGIPLPGAHAVAVAAERVPLGRPAEARAVRGHRLISSHGPRAPPHA